MAYDHSNPLHRDDITMPRECPPVKVGDKVLFSYGEHGWVPATVTKVRHTEYYQHLPGRAVSTYVDLEVPMKAETHHQYAEFKQSGVELPDYVVKPTHVGYSNNPDHVGMWRFP